MVASREYVARAGAGTGAGEGMAVGVAVGVGEEVGGGWVGVSAGVGITERKEQEEGIKRKLINANACKILNRRMGFILTDKLNQKRKMRETMCLPHFDQTYLVVRRFYPSSAFLIAARLVSKPFLTWVLTNSSMPGAMMTVSIARCSFVPVPSFSNV